MEAAHHPWPALGVLMVRDDLISKEELEAILQEQREVRQQRISGRQLGELLVARGMVTTAQVARLVAEQYELPFMELDTSDIDLQVARLLREELTQRFSALPVSRRPDGSYLLAIADPGTVLFSDELRGALGSPLHFVVVGPDAIGAAIEFVHRTDEAPLSPQDEDQPEANVVELRSQDSIEPATWSADESHFDLAGPVAHRAPPLGAMLVREGLLSDDELEAALAQQRLTTSWRLGEILVTRGIVSRSVVAQLVAEQYELPFVKLAEIDVDPVATLLLPWEIARQYPAIPTRTLDDGSLEVAIADPTNRFYPDELHAALGVPLAFVVADPDEIDAMLDSIRAPAPVSDAAPYVHPVEIEDPAESFVEASASAPSEDDEQIVSAESYFPYVVETSASDEEPVEWLPTWTTELRVPDAEVELVADEVELADDEVELPVDEVERADDEVELPVDQVELSDDELGLAVDEAELDQLAETHVEPEESDPVEDELPTVLLAEVTGTDETAEPPVLDDRAPEPTEAAVSVEVEHDDVPETTELPNQDEDAAVNGDDLEAALEHALVLGATAIHLSPQGESHTVRARIDGLVRELGVVSEEDLESLLERFEPTMRVQAVSTRQGDKVTLFPRELSTAPATLVELGLAADAVDAICTALAQPSGALVACGPTGSGTTTTLYAALDVLNTPERVVATVEDPIDRLLEGVDQIEVDAAAGVTLEAGLQTLLAADTDAVLVGEIRNGATAEIAFQAAFAGRHVISALRAPSVAAAIRRLARMGIEPNVLGGALTCVVSQRLVRRVCTDCRETYYAAESELVELGLAEGDGPRLLARGRGCAACAGTGFRGRVGIFEVLSMTDEIRGLVSDGATTKKIHRAAVASGMRTLQEDGIRLCLEGVTTAAEVQRVLGVDS